MTEPTSAQRRRGFYEFMPWTAGGFPVPDIQIDSKNRDAKARSRKE
jgi:hypothetical protein